MYSDRTQGASCENRRWKNEEMNGEMGNTNECRAEMDGCGDMGHHNCSFGRYRPRGGNHAPGPLHGCGGGQDHSRYACNDERREEMWNHYQDHRRENYRDQPRDNCREYRSDNYQDYCHDYCQDYCQEDGRNDYRNDCRDDRRDHWEDDCRDRCAEYKHNMWADSLRKSRRGCEPGCECGCQHCRRGCGPGCECGCQHCCTSHEKARGRRKQLLCLHGIPPISAEAMCKLKEVMGAVTQGLLGAHPCEKVMQIQSKMFWIQKIMKMNQKWAQAHGTPHENTKWTVMILPMIERVAKCLQDQGLRNHLANSCESEEGFEHCKTSCDRFIQLALAMCERMKAEKGPPSAGGADSQEGGAQEGGAQEWLEKLIALAHSNRSPEEKSSSENDAKPNSVDEPTMIPYTREDGEEIANPEK